MSLEIRHVQAGACVLKTDAKILDICALQATDCPIETDFLSSRQLLELQQERDRRHDRRRRLQQEEKQEGYDSLRQLDHELDDLGVVIEHDVPTQCLQRNETEVTHVGRCVNDADSNTCTSLANACRISTDFIPHDSTCTMTSGISNTLYPSCHLSPPSTTSQYTCVWDNGDCHDGLAQDAYEYPSMAFTEDCVCDEVQTGACYHAETQTYHCAVSSESCDNETQFQSWKFVLLSSVGPQLDCRLCYSEQQQPREQPQQPQPPIPMDDNPNGSNSSSSSSSSNSGATAAGIVLGIVGAIVLIGLVWFGMKRCRNEKEMEGVVDVTSADNDNDPENVIGNGGNIGTTTNTTITPPMDNNPSSSPPSHNQDQTPSSLNDAAVAISY